MTLTGKIAFVTGASRGSGAAIARALHARGVNLGLASRSGDALGLASEAGRCGLPYETVYCASKFGQVGFTRALDDGRGMCALMLQTAFRPMSEGSWG